MIKRAGEYEGTMKTTNGFSIFKMQDVILPNIPVEKITALTCITMEPGVKVGFHEHIGDSEYYYIMSGKALYSDNGEMVELNPGDWAITPDGEGHSIESAGDVPLVFVACIFLS